MIETDFLLQMTRDLYSRAETLGSDFFLDIEIVYKVLSFFETALESQPIDCHYMSGAFAYLAKSNLPREICLDEKWLADWQTLASNLLTFYKTYKKESNGDQNHVL
jgi:hypothetical protein